MPGLINLLAFQLLWLALVVGAAHQLENLAISLLLAWLVLHVRLSHCAAADIRLLLLALALGPLADTALMHLQLIEYQGLTLHPDLPPLWVYAQWANFSLLLNHSLKFLRDKPLGLAALSLLSAPLAYLAGARLGAANLVGEPGWLPLLLVALCWSLILPTLVRVSGLAASKNASTQRRLA